MKKLLLAAGAAATVLVLCGCLNGFARETETVPETAAEQPAATPIGPDLTRSEPERHIPDDSEGAAGGAAEGPARRDAALTVTVQDGTQICTLPLDAYVLGVVCAEMPASFPPEALKAQAVAARTFALRRSSKHPDGAVCTDPACCQAWNDPNAADWGRETAFYLEKLDTAVRETDGLVLTYGGELIEAAYFACSGGRTEAAQAVWGTEVPYLQCVDSPGEETAPRYAGEVILPLEQFCETLQQAEPDLVFAGAPETWVGDVKRTEGNGVEWIQVCGFDISGAQIRRLFALNSTNFSLSVDETEARFITFGYGHRVGMSQYGAKAMAQQGASFSDILSYYYPGTELEMYRNN